MMKFIDLFSGIGGFHSGLENAGMRCIGWCEIDKFARKSYEAIYDTTELWTATDIRFIRGWDMPKADLWSFGFPCQDISIAGKQQGIKRGTRSGLYFEVMRLLDEAGENKPKWLIAENVKNLMSIRGGGSSLQLSLKWKNEGTLSHGVFTTPRTMEFLKIEKEFTLSDILETQVDERYYLPQELVKKALGK